MKPRAIIDSHMHTLYGRPMDVAGEALRLGMERLNVLSCACSGELGHGPLNNLMCMAIKRQNPEICYVYAGLVHPLPGEALPDYAEQAKLWLDAGADGMKFIETKPTVLRETGVRLNHPEFEAMWQMLEAQGVPMVWHVGDPATFWSRETAPGFAIQNNWLYEDPAYPSLGEIYGETESVLARHPGLRATFAHFYFTSDDMDHARRILDTYPEVRFDLTPGTEMYANFSLHPEAWRNFFIEYQDRLIFGTDNTEPDPGLPSDHADKTVELVRRFLEDTGRFRIWDFEIQGLGLEEAVLDKIYRGNFERFSGPLKPLNFEAMERAVEWTLQLLQRRGNAGDLDQARRYADLIFR